MIHLSKSVWICVMLLWFSILNGCMALPSPSKPNRERAAVPIEEIRKPAIDATPHPRLDRVEHVVEWPKRLAMIILKRKDEVPDEAVSPETVMLLREYLAEHGLSDVTVVVNEYAPSEQWRRLRENQRLSFGWKYSFGMASAVAGAILPNRVFDRNCYNPHTNTLEINSDRPFDILGQAVVAGRVEELYWRGAYSASLQLPLIGIIPRLTAGYEVLKFAKEHDAWELERTGYRELYTQTASIGMMPATPFLPFYAMPVVAIGGNFVGAQLADRKIKSREQERLHSLVDLDSLTDAGIE